MTDSPLLETRLTVLPEELDENGHMTTNAYLPAFDQATEKFFRQLQIDWTYANGKLSLFTLGMNIDFHNELRLADNLSISTSLLDYDHKRIHIYHQLMQADAGYLAASNELLIMNMSMQTRRSASFTEEIQDKLESLSRLHASQAVPKGAFRKLGIRKKENTDV
jgi:acyl-CoA thioester hydrolase